MGMFSVRLILILCILSLPHHIKPVQQGKNPFLNAGKELTGAKFLARKMIERE